MRSRRPSLRPGDVSGVRPGKPRRIEKLAGIYHAHGCTQCGCRYADRCNAPTANDRCGDCLGAMSSRSVYDLGNDPQPCCRTESVTATAAEMDQHMCAGDGPWWICGTCKRTHPYNPTTIIKE